MLKAERSELFGGLLSLARGVIAFSVCLTSCAVVIGCVQAEPRFEYDSDGLEALIFSELVPDRPEMVTEVDCPEHIGQNSTVVLCPALVGGMAVEVRAEIDDRDRVELSADDFFLVDVDELEEHGGQRLADDLGGPVEVLCDAPSLLLAVAGKQLACEAVDPSGERYPLEVAIVSPDGDWQMQMRSR